MTLIQLQYFISVCETCSITKSANAMFVSQPTVTRALHALESEFGVSLFTYNKKRLTITDEGKRLYQHANAIFDQIEQIREELSRFSNSADNRLVIMMNPATALIFSPAIHEFRIRFPAVSVEIKEVVGLSDVAFVNADSTVNMMIMRKVLMREDMSNFGSAHICYSQKVLYVAENSPLASLKSITQDIVSDRPVIVLYTPKDKEAVHIPELKTLCQKYEIRAISDQLLISLDAVQKGRNYLFEDAMFGQSYPGIVGIPFEPTMKTEFVLYYRLNQKHNPAFQNFLNFLRGWYGRSRRSPL